MMKRRLAAVLMLCLACAVAVYAAITIGASNSADNGNTGQSTVVVVLTGVTAGSTIVCNPSMNNPGGTLTFTKVSDDKNGPGTSYTVDVAAHAIPTVVQLTAIVHISNVVAGTTTITAQFSNSNQFGAMACVEIKGTATSGVVDVAGTFRDATGTNPFGNAITTTVNGDYIFVSGNMNCAGTVTAGSGFTIRNTMSNACMYQEDQIQSTAGSITPTFNNSTSDTYGIVAVAFKPAAGGGPTVVPRHRETMYGMMRRKESEGYAQIGK